MDYKTAAALKSVGWNFDANCRSDSVTKTKQLFLLPHLLMHLTDWGYKSNLRHDLNPESNNTTLNAPHKLNCSQLLI